MIASVLAAAVMTLAVGSVAGAKARSGCSPRPRANLAGCVYIHRNLAHADFVKANLTGAQFIDARLAHARFAGARLAGVRSGGDSGRPASLPKGWSLTRGYLTGPKADLAGAQLDGADLAGRRLIDAKLTGAQLNGADVKATDFAGALFAGVTARGVIGAPAALPDGWTERARDLVGPGADLASANLAGADLDQVDLTGANLAGADLAGAILNESVLSDASLSSANLGNVAGIQLDLSGADVSGATLTGAQMTDADLTNSNLSHTALASAQFTGAAVVGAQLTGANLANVSSGSLTGSAGNLPANWVDIDGHLLGPGASLQGANLAKLDLSGIDLAGAHLAGADLSGADLTHVNLTGADLSGANLQGANLTSATITSANIAAAQLAGATLTGADVTGTSGTAATLPAGWAQVNGALTEVSSSIAEVTYFNQGQWIESANGQFTVDMQSDGNLVEYQGGTAIWATGTSGADQAVMQSDCNFVIYRAGQVGQPAGALYTTGSGGDPNAGCTFAVAADGSLSVATNSGTVRWERYANGTIFTHRITMTQNAGLYNGTNTSSGQTDTIPTGDSPGYVCWTTGQVVNNVNVWFYVLWNNKAGYYPSGDDSSVYATDSRISIDYGIPACGSVPTTFTPPSNGSTGQVGPATIKAPIAVTTSVNLRPGTSTASGSPLGTMPAGTSPGFLCWTTGEVVGGVDVWFKVYWSGTTGYYASGLDNSTYTTDSQITTKYGIPPCPGTSTGGGSGGGGTPAGGATGTTTGGANTAIEAAAANWARAQVGSKAWEYACLAFVYRAWEAAGVSRAALNQIAGYTDGVTTYPVDEWAFWTAGHPPGGVWHSGFDPAPPAGAIIFYSNKLGHDYSHATISLGGGSMISPGTAGVIGPVSVTYNSYASMLGWWMPK